MKHFEALLALADKLSEDDAIMPSQIPNIDLYVDQVTTFLEQALRAYKRTDDDKIMTKTMINNYTKDKVLPPPEQKKYSKNHIILMILIYHLKQSLSIGDIMRLMDMDFTQVEKVYDAFTRIQSDVKRDLTDDLRDKHEKILSHLEGKPDERLETLLLIITLILDANLKKQLACQILDALPR